MSTATILSQDNPRRGIVMMLISVFFFAVLNVLVKHLGDKYPVPQVAFFRCLFALVPALMMVAATNGFGSLKTKRIKGHIFRATVGTASMLLIFYAFHFLPLATAVAINFSGPLFVAIFSILILHEKVGPHRWGALIVGFIGVLVMLQPGQTDLDWVGALMALGSSMFYGLSMVGVRSLGHTESHATSVFYFSLFSAIITVVPMPFVWQAPDLIDFLLFMASGIIAGLGQLFMTRAYQCAPAALVSPFGYSGILWAVTFGYFFWNDVPGKWVFIGSVIVVAAGLYIVYREAYKKKKMVTDVHSLTPDQPPVD